MDDVDKIWTVQKKRADRKLAGEVLTWAPAKRAWTRNVKIGGTGSYWLVAFIETSLSIKLR